MVAPCALGAVINDASLPKLRCRIVAGAANNQLAEDRHGQELHDRGILYAPDYVINAGGLINVYNELIGYNREVAMRTARGIYASMLRLFEIARAQSLPATSPPTGWPRSASPGSSRSAAGTGCGRSASGAPRSA